MNSPSNHQQKVKVCYEQQLREIRIRRNRLRGILHNDVRCTERRTSRQQRTSGKSAPADAGSSVCATCSQTKRPPADARSPVHTTHSQTKRPPTDERSSVRATRSQAKRAEACRSSPSCQSTCLRTARTPPSGATPPCTPAPFWSPPPHPEPCALLGEAGDSAVACRCASCMGMDRAGVDDCRERRLLLWGRLLL